MKYKNIALIYTKLKNLILVLIFSFLCKCTNKYNIKNVTTLNEFKKAIKSSLFLKNIHKDIPQIILNHYNIKLVLKEINQDEILTLEEIKQDEILTLEEIRQELSRNYESLIYDDLSLISRLKTNISQEYFISEENYIEIYNELKTILKSQQFKNNINEIVDEFICDEKNKVKYKTRLNTLLGIQTKNTYELKKIITKENQTKLTIEGYCRKIFSNMKQQLPKVLLNMIMKFYPFCYDYTILDINDIELVSFITINKWNHTLDKKKVFSEVEFYDINSCNFFDKNKFFYKSSFKYIILNGANLSNANLQKADLTNICFLDANLYEAKLEGANLTDAYLYKADLTRAYLYKANLTGVYLDHTYLNSTRFYHANLTNANLNHADLSSSYLISTNLTGANLYFANLSGVNLTFAKLIDANLTNAVLTNADLSYAYLKGTNLTDADLTGADLTGADLTGANLYNTNISGAIMKNTIINYFKQINKIAKSVIDNNGLDAKFVLKEGKIVAFLSKYFLNSGLKAIKKHDKNNFELIVKLLMEYFRNKLSYKKFNSSEVFIKEVQKFYNLKKIRSTLKIIKDMYQSEINNGFIKIID